MPVARVNGIRLSYSTHGTGPPVLLVPPAATPSALWQLHQVPALVQAGYTVVTFENRGTAPSDVPAGPYRLADLAADTADLITELGIGPCPVIGASLGAMVTQELALARPDLVLAAVMLATRSRVNFFSRTAARASAARMRDTSATSASETVAHMSLLLGTATLANDQAAADWFTILRHAAVRGAGAAAQYEATVIGDRTLALSGISRPCLVVAFSEDRLMPPAFCREVASAIPGCLYVEISETGHMGYLEDPGTVNASILEFLRAVPGRGGCRPIGSWPIRA